MPLQFDSVPAPAGPVFRVSRRGRPPFAPPLWDYAGEDGTFGGRFDDPGGRVDPSVRRPIISQQERFRVIYVASSAVGAFGETLAQVRPDLSQTFVDPDYIDDDGAEPRNLYLAGIVDPRHPGHGIISADWRANRTLSTAIVPQHLEFVDTASPRTMSAFRSSLGPLARMLGIADVDFSTVVGPQRRFTQECARQVYEQHDAGQPRYAGLRYLSRQTSAWECWAIFADRVDAFIDPGFPASIRDDDPAFNTVASIYGLLIETAAGRIAVPLSAS